MMTDWREKLANCWWRVSGLRKTDVPEGTELVKAKDGIGVLIRDIKTRNSRPLEIVLGQAEKARPMNLAEIQRGARLIGKHIS